MKIFPPLAAAILLIVLVSLSLATVAAHTTDVPDLRITANNLTITPATIKDEVTATFKAKVENIGTAKAGNVTTRFFVGDTQIGEKATTSINKNQSTTVSVTYAIPASMVGNQTLRVVVDPNNTIAEGNETNNEATKDFTVWPNQPDLSLSSADITVTPASFKSGDQVTFKATIKNTGAASASNVMARFFLAETQIGEKNAGTINANSSKSAQLVYRLPGNLTGEQILKVAVDPDNSITETSEANNEAEKNITISGSSIDLVINEGNITFSNTSPKPGQSITIAATQ